MGCVVARSVAVGAALLLVACQREHRNLHPPAQTPPPLVDLSDLYPGGGRPPPPDPRDHAYETQAMHISNGQRYFNWFNCTGCHSNGGGGIGPSLIDNRWRYGGRMDQIYDSIAQGRPNGMPAFGTKIPPGEIWELAAYVRSLSGHVNSFAASSRQDAMSSTPALDTINPKPLKGAAGDVTGGGG